MKAASGLVSGQQPLPELAGEAVRLALARAGLQRAGNVILFLTRDFARQPQPAVVAAARAAGCLSVSGSTAHGLFTETGWQLDQPAAAALVIAAPADNASGPSLSFSTHNRLPFGWQDDRPRAGILDSDGAVWANGRVAEGGCADCCLPTQHVWQALSSGLRALGEAQIIDQCRGYDLLRLGGQRATDSLLRLLPPDLRQNPPWHQIALLRSPNAPAIAILSANADGSLTLAESIEHATALTWALRQPLAAEGQMHEALTDAARRHATPAFALMFSCIGRGPLFYGDDDRDLLVFRETFPDTPLLGAYGTSQIVPLAGRNSLFHHTALTLLYESSHV